MTIFVAGSVENEINQDYIEEAKKVAEYVDITNSNVICCADERGIVGNFYRQVKDTDKLILTVPKTYLHYAEKIKDKIDIITDTINERTDILIQKADILLFFPGGIGTIYELFSALETKKGGEHHKPIILVNYFGYYQEILKQIEKAYQEKFIAEQVKDLYVVANTSQEVIAYLEEYQK